MRVRARASAGGQRWGLWVAGGRAVLWNNKNLDSWFISGHKRQSLVGLGFNETYNFRLPQRCCCRGTFVKTDFLDSPPPRHRRLLSHTAADIRIVRLDGDGETKSNVYVWHTVESCQMSEAQRLQIQSAWRDAGCFTVCIYCRLRNIFVCFVLPTINQTANWQF